MDDINHTNILRKSRLTAAIHINYMTHTITGLIGECRRANKTFEIRAARIVRCGLHPAISLLQPASKSVLFETVQVLNHCFVVRIAGLVSLLRGFYILKTSMFCGIAITSVQYYNSYVFKSHKNCHYFEVSHHCARFLANLESKNSRVFRITSK